MGSRTFDRFMFVVAFLFSIAGVLCSAYLLTQGWWAIEGIILGPVNVWGLYRMCNLYQFIWHGRL